VWFAAQYPRKEPSDRQLIRKVEFPYQSHYDSAAESETEQRLA